MIPANGNAPARYAPRIYFLLGMLAGVLLPFAAIASLHLLVLR